VSWDHSILYDPITDSLESPLCLPDSIPFGTAKDLAVSLPQNDQGLVDIYINDTIGITPDLDGNTCQVSRAIPLAIRTLSRPLDESNAIPRIDIISLKKYKAEGRMEEEKIVRGGRINTRSLQISLPSHKHKMDDRNKTSLLYHETV
jgi:hypothetical protein